MGWLFFLVNVPFFALALWRKGWRFTLRTALLGVALIIVFRHGSSLGGFNILALIAQEQFNLRGGYVQMTLDRAVIMNLILALNHRPGRYRA